MYAYIVVSLLVYFFGIGWPFAVLVLAMGLVLVGYMAPVRTYRIDLSKATG